MNLVCDEGIERQIVEGLRLDGHTVLYVAELAPSIDDDAVLAQAAAVGAPLLTNDKDFGELVFRQGRASSGVVLIRMSGLSTDAKTRLVVTTIRDHAEAIPGSFVVIAPGQVRIRSRRS